MFWRTLLGWLVPTIVHLFQCIACTAFDVLTDEMAKRKGWRYDPKRRGWCCPSCAKAE